MKLSNLVLVAGAALLAASASYAAEDAIAQKAGCLACHSKDKKIVGPAYKDVAAKYKGQNVEAKLVEKVRKGGVGVWGQIPMPPNPPDKINDADLKAVVEWVLKG
ncbi:MAG TPA: c-type cytochrome [Rhodocyclaceae bacterium]